VAIWTGLEAQSRLGPYTMSTTYDEAVVVYEDGVMYQSLATAFWIGSGAVAVGALVMAFFTDWGGSAPADQSPAQVSWLPTLQLSPAGGSLGVVGRF
ncbi:MAG: hypothetical protein K8H88_23240, partial [Sandaracinaceae bacterium]|nr:hypothetical protein [Sandaracinaceae bacterium]